jgi:probable HAF family extracellular repeat protein
MEVKMKRNSFLLSVFFACLVSAPLLFSAQPGTRYTVIELGTLGGTYSVANGISNSGWVSGISTLPGDTAIHAFAWRNGVMTDLGTLGGPDSGNFFLPNDRGEVTGAAETSTPDPLGQDFCGFGTHLICPPFVWWHGVMVPLPTLGGTSGGAAQANNRGEAVGAVYNTTSDPTCIPPEVQRVEAVVWENGTIRQLPNYAGDTVGAAHAINDNGQITGWSGNCAFTLFHALLWDHGRSIYLGSLGGAMNTQGLAINNQGQVVGFGDLAGDNTFDAFFWERGVMTDLGTLPGDVASAADGINSKGQVVGGSFDASGNVRGTIWQDGVITDLNTLTAPNSPFVLAGDGINDAGQIAVEILLPDTGQVHAGLLIPGGRDGTESAASTSAGVVNQARSIVMPEIARQWIQRRVPFGRFNVGPQRPH